jgi:hypothetical protein
VLAHVKLYVVADVVVGAGHAADRQNVTACLLDCLNGCLERKSSALPVYRCIVPGTLSCVSLPELPSCARLFSIERHG